MTLAFLKCLLHTSEQFCELSRQHLNDILERTSSNLNVDILTSVLRNTITFETDLCHRFASRAQPQVISAITS